MTWPSGDVDTTAMDSGSDTPPRATFLSWAQKFNQLINHFTSFMQGLMTSVDAAAARTTLGALSSTMNTARLHGRTTASAGAVEEITVSGGLSLASGALTAVNASTTVPGKVELSDATEFNTGTDTTRVPPVSVIRENLMVFGTPVTFSSQTEILSEAIPAWAREVEVHFVGLSTNGTSIPILQLVDSGGPEASGHNGATSTLTSGVSSANHSSGVFVAASWAAATVVHGCVRFTRLDAGGTTWTYGGSLGGSNAAATYPIGGSKILSGRLTNINLTTFTGTNQFDNTGSGFVVFAWK